MGLIRSDRHTDDDIREWGRLTRLDSLNAKRWEQRLGEKRARAASDIATFAKEPCYAGCSWGKDSLVLAHIIATHSPEIPIVWVRVEGVENPDCQMVRDAFLRRWDLNYSEVHAPPGATRTSAPGFEIAAHRFGDRHISGVRAEEAPYRALRMRKHGISTNRTCAPLGWWKTAEIFAYAHTHDLPLHPAYGMTGGGMWGREHRRVGAVGGNRGTGWGRRDWEMAYYPEFFRG